MLVAIAAVWQCGVNGCQWQVVHDGLGLACSPRMSCSGFSSLPGYRVVLTPPASIPRVFGSALIPWSSVSVLSSDQYPFARCSSAPCRQRGFTMGKLRRAGCVLGQGALTKGLDDPRSAPLDPSAQRPLAVGALASVIGNIIYSEHRPAGSRSARRSPDAVDGGEESRGASPCSCFQ